MPMKELRDVQQDVLKAIPTPEFRRLSFDPSKPSGPVRDELGNGSLNIGVTGLLIIVTRAGGATDWQLERLLDGASVCKLREWLPLYYHISHGTVPPHDRPDERGRLAIEYWHNRHIYERLGFSPPAIG